MKSPSIPDDFWTDFPTRIANFVSNLNQMVSDGVDVVGTSSLNAWMQALAQMTSPNASAALGK
jgi:hypothetical protein